MDNDSDFIMRQIKSFAEGFGIVVGKKGAPKTEIIYQQEQNQKGKVFTDIDNLLEHRKFEQAVHYVYDQKFQLERGEYHQLGEYLIKRLQSEKDVNVNLLSEFVSNMKK